MAYTGRTRLDTRKGAFISIDLLGDKEAQELLRRLPMYLQKSVVDVSMKAAIRPQLAAAKREVMALERGGGRMAKVAKKLRIVAIRKKRGLRGYRVSGPKRVDLGIPPRHKYYYPAVVTYGTATTPPNDFMFRAHQATKDESFKIAKDLILKGVRLGWQSRA